MGWTEGKAGWAIGALLCVLGVAICVQSRSKGINDYRYSYVLSRMLVAGRNPYDPSALDTASATLLGIERLSPMPYPPSTGFVLLPLAAVSHDMADALFLVLSIGALAVGIVLLMRAYAPDMRGAVVLIAVGLVLCSGSMRWGVTSLQSSPIVAGLLCAFVWALARKRSIAAAVFGTAGLCLKFTNGLPFVALAVFQKRYALACCIVGLFVAVNGLGFARAGGLRTVGVYLRARGAATGTVDSPDPHEDISLSRLDWPYLLNAIHRDIRLSSVLGLLLSVATFLTIWHFARKLGSHTETPTGSALLLAPTACLSVMWIYHHHYEIIALMPPLLAFVLGPHDLRTLPGVRWFVWPIAAVAWLYFVKLDRIALAHVGPTAATIARVVPALAVAIALAGSLVALHAYVERCRSAQEPSSP